MEEILTSHGLLPEDYQADDQQITVLPSGIEKLRANLGKVRVKYKLEKSSRNGAIVLAMAAMGGGSTLRSAEALGEAGPATTSGTRRYVEAAQRRARSLAILELSEMQVVAGRIVGIDGLKLAVSTGIGAEMAATMAAPAAAYLGATTKTNVAIAESLREEAEQRGIEISGQDTETDGIAETPQETRDRIQRQQYPEVQDAGTESGKPEAAPVEPGSPSQEASAGAAENGNHALEHLTDEDLRDTFTDLMNHDMIWAAERKKVLLNLNALPREKLFAGIDFYGTIIEQRKLDGKD